MRRGVRSVLLVTERFLGLAETVRRTRGMVDAPYVVLPVTEATEYGDPVKVDALLDQAVSEVIQLLVAPQ
jgi:hypothetical protein